MMNLVNHAAQSVYELRQALLTSHGALSEAPKPSLQLTSLVVPLLSTYLHMHVRASARIGTCPSQRWCSTDDPWHCPVEKAAAAAKPPPASGRMPPRAPVQPGSSRFGTASPKPPTPASTRAVKSGSRPATPPVRTPMARCAWPGSVTASSTCYRLTVFAGVWHDHCSHQSRLHLYCCRQSRPAAQGVRCVLSSMLPRCLVVTLTPLSSYKGLLPSKLWPCQLGRSPSSSRISSGHADC